MGWQPTSREELNRRAAAQRKAEQKRAPEFTAEQLAAFAREDAYLSRKLRTR